MKKALLFLTLLLPIAAWADVEKIEIDGIFYTFTKSTAIVVAPDEGFYSGDVIIPDHVFYYEWYYPVRGIEKNAFGKSQDLTSVVIPNTVTSIGDQAFYYCTSLASIEIPNSVDYIGKEAFYGCSSLTQVTVHQKKPLEIEEKTFTNSSNATLYVPYGCKRDYDEAKYWKDFKSIFEMDPQCETPIIVFDDGRVTFKCETEGVKFFSTISPAGEQTSTDETILLTDMVNTYRVCVYAKKEGYLDSEKAIRYFPFRALKGDINDDGQLTIADVVNTVNIILGNSF